MYKDRHENLTSALLAVNQEIEEIEKGINVHEKNMKKQTSSRGNQTRKVFVIM